MSISVRRRQHAELHNEKLLERVNYSTTFPWVTKEMEIFAG